MPAELVGAIARASDFCSVLNQLGFNSRAQIAGGCARHKCLLRLRRPDVMEPRRRIAAAQLGEVRLSDQRLDWARAAPPPVAGVTGDRRDQAPATPLRDREIGQKQRASWTK